MKTQKINDTQKVRKALRPLPEQALAGAAGGERFLFCTPIPSDPMGISYDCTNVGEIIWVNDEIF